MKHKMSYKSNSFGHMQIFFLLFIVPLYHLLLFISCHYLSRHILHVRNT